VSILLYWNDGISECLSSILSSFAIHGLWMNEFLFYISLAKSSLIAGSSTDVVASAKHVKSSLLNLLPLTSNFKRAVGLL
jgi:hypothetical protein